MKGEWGIVLTGVISVIITGLLCVFIIFPLFPILIDNENKTVYKFVVTIIFGIVSAFVYFLLLKIDSKNRNMNSEDSKHSEDAAATAFKRRFNKKGKHNEPK